MEMGMKQWNDHDQLHIISATPRLPPTPKMIHPGKSNRVSLLLKCDHFLSILLVFAREWVPFSYP